MHITIFTLLITLLGLGCNSVSYANELNNLTESAPLDQPDNSSASPATKLPKGLHVYVRRSDSADTNILMRKAYSALNKGNNEAAIQVYKQILISSPDNTDATLGLAVAYQSNKEYSNANKLYVKLIKNGHKEPHIIQNLSKSLYEQNSKQSFDILMQLHDTLPDSDIVASQIAIFHMQRANHVEAIPFLRKAIFLSPKKISYRYNLGIALEKTGQNSSAQETYMKALEILENKEDNSSSMDNYSLIHSRLTTLQAKRDYNTSKSAIYQQNSQ